MDWSSLGTTLAKAGLTGLSTALLGPAGPTVAGLVCGWLGLDATSPDAPAQADAAIADPNILAGLHVKAMEHEQIITRLILEAEVNRLAQDTAQMQTVNATMQAEARAEHWPQWSWRPAWGFISAAAFLVLVVLVCLMAWDAVQSKDMAAINMIPQLVFSFTTLFTIPGAILGVTAWKRGQEKIEAIKAGGAR